MNRPFTAALSAVRRPPVLLGGIVLAGLALRLYLLQASGWMVEGDEAVIGLIARHIVAGERPVFFYGVPYLGMLEAYLVALPFALAGSSAPALKLVPLAFSLAFVLLTYFLGKAAFDHRTGLWAALLAAIPPIYCTVGGLKAWGATIETLVLGDVLLLVAWKIVYSPADANRKWQLYLWLGLLAGLAFWTYWLIAYYLVTVLFFLFLKDKTFFWKREFLAFGLGFGLGSLPLWIYNLQFRWATFRYLLGGDTLGDALRSAPAVFGQFATVSLPPLIGAWQPWSENVPLLGGVTASVSLIAGGYVLALRRKGIAGWFRLAAPESAPADTLIFLALIVPILFSFTRFGRTTLNPWGLDTAGRYLLPLFSVIPVVIAAFLARLQRLWPRTAWMLGVALLAGNLLAHVQADKTAVFQSPYYPWPRIPASHAPVMAYLNSQGVQAVWANHWAGHPLMFASQERIIAADYYDVAVAGGIDRFPVYTRQVRQAQRTAFLIIAKPGEPVPRLEQDLIGLGVTFDKQVLPPYVVYVPTSRRVDPSEVVAGLAFPY